jgi:chromosomal replication initiation ATPase DnaA
LPERRSLEEPTTSQTFSHQEIIEDREATIKAFREILAGKERTQEEFFHTFNSLYESHKQMVMLLI